MIIYACTRACVFRAHIFFIYIYEKLKIVHARKIHIIMIFSNEYVTLHICQYASPDDITALARASRDIRAMMMPHMRYIIRETTLNGSVHSIIRRDVIRPRFDHRDTSFEIVPGNYIIRPDVIPHDYTGAVSIYSDRNPLNSCIITFLWAESGIVSSEVFWQRGNLSLMYVTTFDRMHLVKYLCWDIGKTVFTLHPRSATITEMLRGAYAGDYSEASDEFQNLLRQFNSL